jgi:hypothetical protein
MGSWGSAVVAVPGGGAHKTAWKALPAGASFDGDSGAADTGDSTPVPPGDTEIGKSTITFPESVAVTYKSTNMLTGSVAYLLFGMAIR